MLSVIYRRAVSI